MRKFINWLKNIFYKRKKKPQTEASSSIYSISKDTAFSWAKSQLGVAEIPGDEHNSMILKYHQETSLKASEDEVPWCAAFVNWCLMKSGQRGTNKANARSFLKWGEATNSPQTGDIVVFWRGGKNSWKGHVGFFVKFDGKSVVCLGGNQGNAVSYKKYNKRRVLGYRRYRRLNGNDATN